MGHTLMDPEMGEANNKQPRAIEMMMLKSMLLLIRNGLLAGR